MKATLRDVWRSALTTLALFGLVVLSMIMGELYSRVQLGLWTSGLIASGSFVATGFWRAWKGSSLLGVVLGSLLASAVVLTAMFALPDPIAEIPPREIFASYLYVPPCSAFLAALGFLLAWLIRARHRRDSLEAQRS